MLVEILFFVVLVGMIAYLERKLWAAEKETRRLNRALLQVERPEVARIAAPRQVPEKTEDQIAAEKQALQQAASLWSR